MNREAIGVGRDRIARLMGDLGLAGARRGKFKRTTISDPTVALPSDLVDRHFDALSPNRLWVADITYVSTWSGFNYVAFVTDVFSRRIVGWHVSTNLHADLALDALEMAIWAREDLSQLVHHSDRGVQYLAIRYSERLDEEGAVTSVGSKGDSYDNTLAETVNGLYKTELIRRRGPWRTVDHLEVETAKWVDWWNNRRLHGFCGRHPAGRVRRELLPCNERGHRGRMNQSGRVSIKPRAVRIGAEVRRAAYDVVVDGEKVGSVEMNDSIEIPTEPGRHTLQDTAMVESRAVLNPSTPSRARPSPSDAPERGSCRSFWPPSSFPGLD